MPKNKVMMRCFMCDNEFQFGPHRYDGKYVPRYDIWVCRICYNGNWDGWGPQFEDRLIEHLNKEGIPVPEKNENGWFPRD